MQTLCYRIDPVAVASDAVELDATAARFLGFWAAWPYPVRLISRLMPQRYQGREVQLGAQLAPLDRARRQGVAHRDAWRWQHLLAERQRYTAPAATQPLMCEHYLVTWAPPEVLAPTVQTRIERAFLTTATPTTLPAFWQHRPVERLRQLDPRTPGDPYLAVLMAHAVRGRWDLHTWHALLALDQPLVLAIDIQTPPKAGFRGTARRVSEAEDALDYLTEKNPRDRHARLARGDAEVANDALAREFIHQLGYAVLLEGPTERVLDQAVQQVEASVGTHLQLTRSPGVQAAQLQFFTAAPRAAIRAPLPTNPAPSHGVAHKTPFAVVRQARDHGLCWGTDRQTGLLHHAEVALSRKRNSSLVCLGRPGFGKTTLMLGQCGRLAVDGTQIVLLEPADRARLLAEAIGDTRACQWVDVAADPAINIPDPASSDPLEQRHAIARRLGVARGTALSDIENALIDQAMEHPRMYGADYHTLAMITPADAPLLDDLVVALQDVLAASTDPQEQHDGRRLVYFITKTLLGTARGVYGRRTTVPTSFHADVTLYSFNNANPVILQLLYDVVFSRLNRFIRRPGRDRPLIMAMDEVRHMLAIKTLAEELIKAFKEWRNFFAAAWLFDQDIETFLAEGGWGRYIVNTATMRLFFRLDGAGMELVEQVFGQRLGPQMLQRIRTLAQGEYIGLWEEDVRTLHYGLNRVEADILTQL